MNSNHTGTPPAEEMLLYQTEDGRARLPTCKEYLQVRQDGRQRISRAIKHDNLDVILAVCGQGVGADGKKTCRA
ncbi:MAG: hypothetical protein HQL97_06815 [Magnetococcales bacterium]|nr:hypothetical protein [Magnetococcales bacterium]